MTALADVADPAICHFCGSSDLEWDEAWGFCRECTAVVRYSHRLGEVVDSEPPDNWDAVSDLLHELRRGY